MIYEYQVLYLSPGGMSLQTVVVQACTPEKAKEAVGLADQCIVVVSVGPGLPVINWQQQTFNRAEAAVYLRCTPSQVDKLMADGQLPKARYGYPIFRRADLDAVIQARMEPSAVANSN
ncbi:MAG: helix-turn-helix domain-containing protein [Verrucomicrobiota bacterium]